MEIATKLMTLFSGKRAANTLTTDEAHRIVSDYESSEVTTQLSEFGQLLLTANRERSRTLETKATLIIGYCIAVIAFLISREPTQGSVVIPVWPPVAIRVASIFAAIGLVFAF